MKDLLPISFWILLWLRYLSFWQVEILWLLFANEAYRSENGKCGCVSMTPKLDDCHFDIQPWLILCYVNLKYRQNRPWKCKAFCLEGSIQDIAVFVIYLLYFEVKSQMVGNQAVIWLCRLICSDSEQYYLQQVVMLWSEYCCPQ